MRYSTYANMNERSPLTLESSSVGCDVVFETSASLLLFGLVVDDDSADDAVHTYIHRYGLFKVA